MIELINVGERACCRDLRQVIARLEAVVAAQRKRIGELEAQVAGLQEELARARKNSSNSSKPPSSDIVKPPKGLAQEGKGERKKGDQPGHPKHERPAFPPDQIDGPPNVYTLEECPDCGGELQASDAAPKVIQQVEIVACVHQGVSHRGLRAPSRAVARLS